MKSFKKILIQFQVKIPRNFLTGIFMDHSIIHRQFAFTGILPYVTDDGYKSQPKMEYNKKSNITGDRAWVQR